MRLKDQVALITGAGSGIGAASARHMAKEGAKIAVCGIPVQGVENVAAQLRADGFEAIGIATDVADEKQVEAAVDKTVAEFGRLDIAVCCAAVQLHDRDHTLHELDEEVWDLTHSINFRGVMVTCKYALQKMVLQGSGSIVIISSVTAMSGGSANVSYLTGKHALLGFNRHVGKHYGPKGIRCNCICPGALEKTPNHDIHPDPEGRAESLAKSIPLGRPATPEDIAPWVTFLCSDEARYANGAHFLVDGGMSA
ncbi:MAG TPA: SDR family oxidoreductase [Candidatus Handelsmanbacteria bacterium]|nr:SDR family oxidoreductase [Candidatus Handelsmanbacteria bacterium]